MKKLLVFLLALTLLSTAALAEIDLSGMTYDELLDLRAQVDQALWASDGWQEVDVPSGVYVVGEDIPAGRWTLTCDSVMSSLVIYPTKADYDNQTYNMKDMAVVSSDNPYNLTAVAGECIAISGNAVTFKPYTSAALGFK